MAFTYDLSTPIGQVRLHIGDMVSGAGVLPDGRNFSDEEIAYVLVNEGNSIMGAVAACCEILANAWASVASVTVGPRREELSHVSEMYHRRAVELRLRYGGGGVGACVVNVGRADAERVTAR